uniref:Tumor necrosis factor receptor superfamily member 14 n=1 Tax=Oplegnathus fasciatus TaxID=163134 RepID=T2HSE2_OPLFA|nr:tumor necrosis factor receptor superfamily member 14 precursor [Oplegnathus fasciatus]
MSLPFSLSLDFIQSLLSCSQLSITSSHYFRYLRLNKTYKYMFNNNIMTMFLFLLGQGLFARQECTTTTDAVCDVLSGFFCKTLADDTGCSLAEKHTHCEPGQRIKEAGTSRTDTVCELCQPGYFSQDGVNCTAWTICSETQRKVKAGNTSSDVVCGTASRQHYCYIPVLLLLTLVGLVITG